MSISFRRVSVPDAFLFLSLEIWSWIPFTVIGPFKISSDYVVSPRLLGGLTTLCDSWVSSLSYKRFWKCFIQSSGGTSKLSSIVLLFQILFISFQKSPLWLEFKVFILSDFYIFYASFLPIFCISFWEQNILVAMIEEMWD